MLKSLQPYGFDVGQSERGTVLKGLDLGVQGMRVGGQVRTGSSSSIYIYIYILVVIYRFLYKRGGEFFRFWVGS